MALVQTISSDYELKEIFAGYGRDYYSLDGYQFIIDYFDDYDTELDVIGITCGFSEYGPHCSIDFTGLLSQYFGIERYDGLAHCTINGEEYVTDDLNDWACFGSLIDTACEYLEDTGVGYRLSNGDFMVVE